MSENMKEKKEKTPKKEKISKEKKEKKERQKTPYLIYWMETRLNVKKELMECGKDTKPSQLTKEIAKRWNELSNDQKNIYKKKADKEITDIKDHENNENNQNKDNENKDNENDNEINLREFSMFAFFAFFVLFAMAVLFFLCPNSNISFTLKEFKIPLIIVDKINYFYNATSGGIGKQIAIPTPSFWNMIKNILWRVTLGYCTAIKTFC